MRETRMRIIHRISFNRDRDVGVRFDDLGVKLKVGDILAVFEAAEADPQWPAIQIILDEFKCLDLVRTEFSEDELETSDLLKMNPGWMSGYPMPDMEFGYRQMTYDLTDHCHDCGIGFVQKAPFRMRGEPKWGKYHVLMLNWVFDEFFVRPEVWEQVFRKYGVPCMPVLKHRTGQPLETVVQLKIDIFATAPLKLGDAPYETCPTCHRTKFLPHRRGFFPAFTARQTADMFKTREYFGSGASAHHEIIVSSRLFREITDNKLKGVQFAALEKNVEQGAATHVGGDD
jgi:hypothetical protein